MNYIPSHTNGHKVSLGDSTIDRPPTTSMPTAAEASRADPAGGSNDPHNPTTSVMTDGEQADAPGSLRGDESHGTAATAEPDASVPPGSDAIDVRWIRPNDPHEWPAVVRVVQSGRTLWEGRTDTADNIANVVEQAAQATGLDVHVLAQLLTGARLEAASGHHAQTDNGVSPDATSNTPSPLQEFDAFVQRWVDGVQPGWGPAQSGQHLEQLLALIEINEQHLTFAGLEAILQTVNRTLKKYNYPLLTRNWLQSLVTEAHRQRARQHELRGQAEQAAAVEGDPCFAGLQQRYVALSRYHHPADGSELCYGIRDRESDRSALTNFELLLEEDHKIEDEIEPHTAFVGHLHASNRNLPFRIRAEDYASDEKFRAALYSAAGSDIQIDCKMAELRNAVAVISPTRLQRCSTTNFGWTEGNDAYLVPLGRITCNGFEEFGADAALRLDLGECQQATHLGMHPLPPSELTAVKRHIVEDLLLLHHRNVTHALLGLAGAAVLRRFSGVFHRFAGWLVGETGTGKTLLVRLFMALFGDYRPGDDNRFASWCWTPNTIEKAGYYFKDALYLVDDYKTGTTWHHQIVRLVQAYGDGAARGRLKSDATFNPVRPIRGLLCATGENTIDHEASSLARTVLIPVEPVKQKDFDRRQRCIDRCGSYNGVMADFLHWLLVHGRTSEFASRVKGYEARYYQQVCGQPNDARVAANLAVLAAAHAQFAEYLGDVWPAWHDEMRRFGEEDVPALLTQMMGAVREQRVIEVFWNTLGDLVRHGRVRLDETDSGHAPAIGKYLAPGRVTRLHLVRTGPRRGAKLFA